MNNNAKLVFDKWKELSDRDKKIFDYFLSGSGRIDIENLRVFHQETHSEMIRYRDREWKNGEIFVAINIALLFLSISDTGTKFPDLLAIFMIIGTCAGIYFLLYAHISLARERCRIARIGQLMKGGSFSRWSVTDLEKNFRSGSWDHLLPVWVVQIFLTVCGISYLKTKPGDLLTYWSYILILLLLIILVFIWGCWVYSKCEKELLTLPINKRSAMSHE